MNLVSLPQSGHLLEVCPDGALTHILTCADSASAEWAVSLLMRANKNSTSFTHDDNIAKVTLCNVGTLARIEDEVLKANMLK